MRSANYRYISAIISIDKHNNKNYLFHKESLLSTIDGVIAAVMRHDII